ncbi:MAG: tetratricopeptide repeat protein [Deltaproteobacteria bacterium]|nr:tetratricopeptide repeat protein [Deltaproteobacteria bacterium]
MTKLKVLLIFVLIVSGCVTNIYDQTYHQSGTAYYKAGNYDAAIEQYKKELEQDPDNSAKYFWIGLSYRNKKQYKDAVVWYQKSIAKDSTSSLVFASLARCYNELNQYDDAIAAGRRAIELDSNIIPAHFELACAFFKTKQHKNAVKAYKKAIELVPEYPPYYNRWGYLLMESGDYAGAAEQYEKAVSLKPNNIKYLSRLSSAYYKQGKYDEALDATNKAISTMSFVGLGAAIGIVNGYPVIKGTFESRPAQKAGIKAGDKIIRIDGKATKGLKPGEIISRLKGQEGTQVVLTIKREDSEKSLEATVMRERIFTAAASTGIGYRSFIQRHRGEKDESLKDAKQAYSLNSSDKWAQLAFGAASLYQERYGEAVQLLSVVKDSATARVLEATAYAKKGDFKKAIYIYSAIPEEKLSPKNVSLWSDRTALLDALKPFIASKMESAGRLKAQRKYKEALKELGEAMKVGDDKTSEEICGSIYRIMSIDPRLSVLPEEARKYALRGDVLTEQGKFEGAVKEYRKAVQAAPYIAKLYFNTAMIYGELKRFSQAIRNMKTYLNLAPEAPNVRAAKDQIYKWEFAMEKKK